MRIPDPIELGEARAERWAKDNIRGDEFRCADCKNWFPIDVAVQATPDPYSVAICLGCADV